MSQSCIVNGNASSALTSPVYAPLGYMNGGGWYSSESLVEQPIPCAGTIDYLLINAGNPAGSGGSFVFTIRKNGSDQAITATLTGSSLSTKDTTHSFSVSAGDLVSLKCVTTSSPNPFVYIRWQVRFTSINNNQCILLGGNVSSFVNSTVQYLPVQGCNSVSYFPSGQAYSQAPVPVPGTFQNLYIHSSANVPGGQSAKVTLNIGGVASAVTATITAGNSTANSTALTQSVVAGNVTSMALVQGSATPASVMWGIVFSPTTNGQSIVLNTNITNGSNNYMVESIGGSVSNTIGATSAIVAVLMNCTISNLYATASSAVSSPTNIVHYLSLNGSDYYPTPAFSVAISAIFAYNNTETVTVTDGQLFTMGTFSTSLLGNLYNYVIGSSFVVKVPTFSPPAAKIWRDSMDILISNNTINLPVYVGTTGLTLTATASKNGGAAASMAGAVHESGSGWYYVAANATDASAIGPLSVTLTDGTHSGWAQFVVCYNCGTVDSLSLTSMVIAGGLSIDGTLYLDGGVNAGGTTSINDLEVASGNIQSKFTGNSYGVQAWYPAKGQAWNDYMFSMYNTDGTPYNGTGASVSGQVSKDGATFGALTNTSSISKVSGENGIYSINLTTTDTNGTVVWMRFTAPGCQNTDCREVLQGADFTP